MKLTIAMIGAGRLGQSLARRFVMAGHVVRFGVRNPQAPRMQSLADSGVSNWSVLPLEQAVSMADVVLFAVPGEAMESILGGMAQTLLGKTLIDATNGSVSYPLHSGEYFKSLGLDALLFRTFNYMSAQVYEQPLFGDQRADLFYCGPSGGYSQDQVEALIESVCARPRWIGGYEQFDLLDSLARLSYLLTVDSPHGLRLALQVLE